MSETGSGGRWFRSAIAFACLAACAGAAAQAPIDGFFPLVGIGLTDEFLSGEGFLANSVPSNNGVSGTLLGAGGVPNFEVGLLDTGAGASVLTQGAFDRFGLGQPSPVAGSDGYRGTSSIQLGGATGQITAFINDPLGLYASGLQDRISGGATLQIAGSPMRGQTNTATLVFPAESPLPNILGIPFASQYSTRIRNDLPQVFQLNGRTVRSPSVEFLPVGGGGLGIQRKIPLSLDPGSAFTSAPGFFQNILNIVDDIPLEENPLTPTALGGGLISGGLFVDVEASNDGLNLGRESFFFDTGASVTVLSQATALRLGIDVVLDKPEFTTSVVGSGGLLTEIPGYFLDSFTIPAIGGSITATNVPVLVLDVTNVADIGNIVPGIVGTNLLSGRNLVIDPNPSIGGGGPSAGVYVSDPVTTTFNWTTSAASAAWSTGSAWSGAATPSYLSQARLTNAAAIAKEAVVSGDQVAWDAVVKGGLNGPTMTVRIASGAKLTTFSGVTVETGGVVRLQNGVLDAQYVDIRGGTLTGSGAIRTGSGPIDGQVEVISGVVAPGDGVGQLTIDGRLATAEGAVLEFQLGGLAAGSQYDQIIVNGSAAIEGQLTVSLVNGFTPTVGASFSLMNYDEFGGGFDAFDLPGGYRWNVTYGPSALSLTVAGIGLAGDFNADGVVDAADYTTWRDGLGTTYTAGDYTVWKNNYGATNVNVIGPALSVPEPSAMALFAIALAGSCKRRR